MTSGKSTKRALITSALAILMCVAMLIGTTFAWFTDTASTGVNKIQAGNLDIELSYKNNSTNKQFKKADKNTPVFSNNALWEPGRVEYTVLNVKNIGTLALKYKLGINIANEVSSTNVLNKEFKLSDYIKFGVVNGDLSGKTRDEMVEAVTDGKLISAGYSKESNLNTTDANETVTLVVWMPTDVGNEANASRLRPSSVSGLGIEVRATQATVENDSFGTDYDANAATVLKRVEYTDGEHTVTGNIQANGTAGAIHGTGTAKITVDATTVYGTYVSNYAMAVCASSRSEITIKGGDFANQAPAGSALSLIYAEDNAKITIEGGTFKCVSPAWTLNCNDSDSATITVKGGSFYKFDPSNVTVGEGEIFIADGYKVVQNGDWYNVVPE